MEADGLRVRNRELLMATGQQDQLDSFQSAEYQKMTEKYRQARADLDTARAECAEQSVRLLSAEFARDKAQQQLKIAQGQLEWSTSEVERVMDDSTTLSKSKSRQITQLQLSLGDLEQQRAYQEQRAREATDARHAAETALADSRRALRDAEVEATTAQESFKHETAKWKQHADAQAALRVETLAHAEQLQADLSAALADRDAARNELEELYARLDRQTEVHAAELAAATERANELQVAFDALNQAYSQLRVVAGDTDASRAFPDAARTGEALKSGKSTSQLWADLVAKDAEILELQDRIAQLESGLDTIMNEMAERAPHFAALKDDNDELSEQVHALNAQVVALEREKCAVDSELHRARADAAAIQDRLEEQRQLTSDVSRQLAKLLAGMNADDVVEELRELLLEDDGGDDEARNSNAHITAHLVEFEHVQALIERNQDLLLQLRKTAADADVLRQHVDTNLTTALARAEGERNSLRQDLDMVRRQLAESFSQLAELQTKHAAMSDGAAASGVDHERSLQMQVELDHQRSASRSLEAKLAQADEHTFEAKVAAGRAQAEVTLLSAEKDTLTRHVTSLRDQVSQLSIQVDRYRQTAAMYEERVAVAEADLDKIRGDLDRERRAHTAAGESLRVLERTASLESERLAHVTSEGDRYKVLYLDLQSVSERQMQEALDKAADAAKREEQLRGEITTLSNKLTAAHEEEKRMLLRHAKEMRELHQTHSESQLKYLDQAQSAAASAAASAVAASLSSTGGGGAHAAPAGNAAAKEAELLARVHDLQADLLFLQGEIKRRDANVQEITAMSAAFEAQLVETRAVLTTRTDEKAALEQALASSQSESAAVAAELEAVRAHSDEIQAVLTQTQSELAELSATHVRTVNQVTSLSTEIEQLHGQYRHQLQMHSADLERLDKMDRERQDLKRKVAALHTQLEELEAQRQTEAAALRAQLADAGAAYAKLEEKMANLRQQNDQLFAKFEDAAEGSTVVDGASKQLLTLLRNERNALMLEKEASIMESVRRTTTMERQIQALKLQLEAAEARAAEGLEAADLRRRLTDLTHQFNLARESNETLRRDKEFYEQQNAAARNDLMSLQTQLNEWRERVMKCDVELAGAHEERNHFKAEADDWKQRFLALPSANAREKEAQLTETEEALRRKEEECREYLQKYNELTLKYNRLVERLRERAGEVEGLQRSMSEVVGARDALQSARDAIQAEMDQLRATVEQHHSQLTQTQAELATAQQFIAVIEERRRQAAARRAAAMAQAGTTPHVNAAVLAASTPQDTTAPSTPVAVVVPPPASSVAVALPTAQAPAPLIVPVLAVPPTFAAAAPPTLASAPVPVAAPAVPTIVAPPAQPSPAPAPAAAPAPEAMEVDVAPAAAPLAVPATPQIQPATAAAATPVPPSPLQKRLKRPLSPEALVNAEGSLEAQSKRARTASPVVPAPASPAAAAVAGAVVGTAVEQPPAPVVVVEVQPPAQQQQPPAPVTLIVTPPTPVPIAPSPTTPVSAPTPPSAATASVAAPVAADAPTTTATAPVTAVLVTAVPAPAAAQPQQPPVPPPQQQTAPAPAAVATVSPTPQATTVAPMAEDVAKAKRLEDLRNRLMLGKAKSNSTLASASTSLGTTPGGSAEHLPLLAQQPASSAAVASPAAAHSLAIPARPAAGAWGFGGAAKPTQPAAIVPPPPAGSSVPSLAAAATTTTTEGPRQEIREIVWSAAAPTATPAAPVAAPIAAAVPSATAPAATAGNAPAAAGTVSGRPVANVAAKALSAANLPAHPSVGGGGHGGRRGGGGGGGGRGGRGGLPTTGGRGGRGRGNG
ncbi:hypothetical protein BC828DRAFT_148996 [Blastocladiella britannica]|nr:hypothetical protein BC828DRAFT_148996 [Blastocladiella britannica]